MKKYTVELTKEQLKQLGIEVETEFKYPLFKRWKISGQICKFTDIRKAETVWEGMSLHKVGTTRDNFTPHTDAMWEDVAYDVERDLWDGQPVECLTCDHTHERDIRFYDVLNRCTFMYDGRRDGMFFDNYKALQSDRYDEWIIKAHKTLERQL